MKQGTVTLNPKIIAGLMLLGGASRAHAQNVEADETSTASAQAEAIDSQDEAPVALRSAAPAIYERTSNAPLQRQAVGLSQAMNPSPVPPSVLRASEAPTATAIATSADDESPESVTGSSNRNAGGTQVIVNATNGQSASTAQNLESAMEASRIQELKMEKKLREKINEERMLERIEEDRIVVEKDRTRGVEDLEFRGKQFPSEVHPHEARNDFAVAPVASPYAVVPVSTVSVGTIPLVADHSDRGFINDVHFKISPMAGTRWFRNNNFRTYRAQNIGLGGVEIEGQLNPFFAVEGTFSYGRDNFHPNAFGVGNAGYMGSVYPNYAYQPGYNSGFNFGGNGFLPLRSRDTYEFGAGVKLGYSMERLRPYLSAGLGALFQRYNIDNLITSFELSAAGLSRTSDHMLGNFGGGLDVALTRNFSIGARYEYQAILNRGRGSLPMHQIWGDAADRMRLTGSAQLVF